MTRGNSRRLGLVLGVVLVAVLLVTAAGLYRRAYGAWPPSAPGRVDLCDRRYTQASGEPGPLPAGSRLRSVGRHPALVGSEFFAVEQGTASNRCPPGSLVRRESDGRFQDYPLSGGP